MAFLPLINPSLNDKEGIMNVSGKSGNPSMEVPITSESVTWGDKGIAICTEINSQSTSKIGIDGSEGAIIIWQDYRNGNNDIYAQRINKVGASLWNPNGTAICTAVNTQSYFQLVSDGSGGAIIAWQDFRSGNNDIYAQRVNSAGITQWTANGTAICTATGSQYKPQLVSDGSGGAIITWYDGRNGNYDIFAQRINSTGDIKWTANGVGVCTLTSFQDYPKLISDGSGGAIIVWRDSRNGNYDIFAQRINSAGVPQWTAGGIPICSESNNQESPNIISDSSGGAIITWFDGRDGIYYDIYAQRVNSAGIAQWTTNGTVICNASGKQYNPQLVSDGSGGAIIIWQDYRSGTDYDIYTQRVNSAGITQWTANGTAVSNSLFDQNYPSIVSDGSGGAIIAWEDYRSGTDYDIYAQRVDSAGIMQWAANGTVIYKGAGTQYQVCLLNDGSGGAIITWTDNRNGNNDIYAQRIRPNDIPKANHPSDISTKSTGSETIDWMLTDDRGPGKYRVQTELSLMFQLTVLKLAFLITPLNTTITIQLMEILIQL
ncbi:MAG: hypothetical protein ACTSPD_17025 [Promethearchaeota archaeon]